MNEVSLGHFGLITAVGLTTRASCTAIRCGIDNFQETTFNDSGGQPIKGSLVETEKPWRGASRLKYMAIAAVQQTIDNCSLSDSRRFPLLLCLSESGRAGRVLEDETAFFADFSESLKLDFHHSSRVLSLGEVGVPRAIYRARELLESEDIDGVLITAVDSLLVGETLNKLESEHLLLTSENNDGIIPGEGAGAFLVTRGQKQSQNALRCLGLGFGVEQADELSGLPLRAEGLVNALNTALMESHMSMVDIDIRIADVAGSNYAFKEASLALTRTLKVKREELDLWNPADCVGAIGSALAVVMLALLDDACKNRYIPGSRMIAHFACLDGRRAAAVLVKQGM